MRGFFVAILLAASFAARGETLTGQVVGVSDGDTITILDEVKAQHKIGVAGIDAPEKTQPFGHGSKQNLSKLVFGKLVLVDYSKRDKYGRIVGKVIVASPDACPEILSNCPKTLDAGLAQITVGLAWHFKKYAAEQRPEDRKMYALAEEEARAKHAGLWRDSAPLPPWEFREGKIDRRR